MALKCKATDCYGDEESQKVRKGEHESSDNSDWENSPELSSNPVEVYEARTSKKKSKKQYFIQFWKEEDAIAILKIAAEPKEKNGTDPSKKYGDLLQLVHKSVRSDATLIQLKNRIRRSKDWIKEQIGIRWH
ncbi:GLABROUS1 enhancer-binding protein family [Dillenia turbinata]|uniref:GLABROUS1 enhancer-binding protein family n=1 Tax=Dillenia turbinata TaxID=194707 RepID=A0AAN8W358_9MAGN